MINTENKNIDEHIYKSHNKTLLLYHIVFPTKYRKKVFTEKTCNTIKDICIKISEKYEIKFIEIGTDEDHIHFLIQSVPTLSLTKIVTIIKSITARQLFLLHPEVKKILWGGNLWTSGYYINTVGLYGNKEVILNYVKNQGKTYTKLYNSQLSFDFS